MAAPKGNRNAAKARDWSDTLKWVLENYEGRGVKRGDALREIATKLVEMALAGNMKAIIEIANRLDGRPALQADRAVAGDVTVIFEDVIATRPEGYTRQYLVNGSNS